MSTGLVVASVSKAQPTTPGGSPSPEQGLVQSLIPCLQEADPKEGFICFKSAMRAAGYRPDAKQVAADKRTRFGLERPSAVERPSKAAPRKDAPAEDEEGPVTVQIARVAVLLPQSRLLLVTAEGALWEQTDDEAVSPRPRSGQTIQIERSSFGGYFCRFDKLTKVRCRRSQ
jgi:hypothetical protein